ncbi:uncharacterized protein MYCFIDRAFT_209772, partial [Pseudocercospora fijiensis CIRAD86]
MRTSHRNMLKIQLAGDKRRAKFEKGGVQGQAHKQQHEAADSSSDVEVVSSKRAKLDSENATSEGNAEGEGEESDKGGGDGELEDGNESGEESDDSNAVSLQDSDILDRMDED